MTPDQWKSEAIQDAKKVLRSAKQPMTAWEVCKTLRAEIEPVRDEIMALPSRDITDAQWGAAHGLLIALLSVGKIEQELCESDSLGTDRSTSDRGTEASMDAIRRNQHG